MEFIKKIAVSEKQRNGFATSLNDLISVFHSSLGKISKYTDISKGVLSRYANNINEPTIYQAYKIARFFNVTIDEMINQSYDIETIELRIKAEQEQSEI